MREKLKFEYRCLDRTFSYRGGDVVNHFTLITNTIIVKGREVLGKPTTCTKADLEVDRPVPPEQPPTTRFAGGISSSSAAPLLRTAPREAALEEIPGDLCTSVT